MKRIKRFICKSNCCTSSTNINGNQNDLHKTNNTNISANANVGIPIRSTNPTVEQQN